MKTVIVDDEPKGIELLKGYLKHFSHIELVATFRNGLKAFEYLSKKPVDLLFLDINMPHISGIALSRMIPPATTIIFVTAHSEYAVESYEIQAADYLLKPVSFERFTSAISKVLTKAEPISQVSETLVHLKSGGHIFRVRPQEILYLKKEGNYMTYFLTNQKILTRSSISTSMQTLPDYFLQVHKSYIVNVQKIDFFNKNEIGIKEDRIPVGASFQIDFLNKMSF
jgi:DNA-binding LytR/AlgR family response regulator